MDETITAIATMYGSTKTPNIHHHEISIRLLSLNNDIKTNNKQHITNDALAILVIFSLAPIISCQLQL